MSSACSALRRARGRAAKRLTAAAMLALSSWPIATSPQVVAAPSIPLEGVEEAPAQALEGALAEALSMARKAEDRGQFAEAELWLERALLIEPENAQARFDWARILLRRGQTESGRALLQSLVDDPRTPEPQRQRLLVLLNGLTAPLSPPAYTNPPGRSALASWRTQWEWSIGRSRNPLTQPSVREVVFTLPQGSLAFELESKPQPAASAGLRLSAEHPSGLLLQAQVQAVDAQSLPAFRLGLLWQPWDKRPDQGLYVQTQRLADRSSRAQGGVQWIYPCNGHPGKLQCAVMAQVGVFTESDTERHGPMGRVSFIRSPHPHWRFTGWGELEVRRGPSGPPSSLTMGLSGEYKPRTDLSFGLQVAEMFDFSGYSPLLENNSARRLLTTGAQLEWSMGRDVQNGFVLRAYAGRRHSNIALFSWNDAGVALVLRSPL